MQLNKVTPQQVTDIVLKTMQNRKVKYSCRAIIAADDAEDPTEHVVFSRMMKPEAAWEMANKEDRRFRDLPDGGKTMFKALVMAWVKSELSPDVHKDDDNEDGDDKPDDE